MAFRWILPSLTYITSVIATYAALLHIAVEINSTNLIDLLVTNKANPNLLDALGNTPLVLSP
jgi:ankyrin repeat protein